MGCKRLLEPHASAQPLNDSLPQGRAQIPLSLPQLTDVSENNEIL